MNADTLFDHMGNYYSHHPNVAIDGRWKLIMPLGHGGMSEVWEAEDTNNASVVLKLRRKMDVNQNVLDDQLIFNYNGRFEQECMILRQLKGKNIPHIIEWLEDGIYSKDPPYHKRKEPKYWLSIKLYGEFYAFDLNKRKEFRNFSIEDRLRRLHKIAIAIDEIHKARILHCDIKPANILVTKSSKDAYLSDFGLSTWIDRKEDSFSLARSNDSKERLRFYTDRYSSYSRTQRHSANIADDLYAFAITVYEILSDGKSPFPRESAEKGGAKDLFTTSNRTWTQPLSLALGEVIERPHKKSWAKDLDNLFAGAFEQLKDAEDLDDIRSSYRTAQSFVGELFRIFHLQQRSSNFSPDSHSSRSSSQDKFFSPNDDNLQNPFAGTSGHTGRSITDTLNTIKETVEQTPPQMKQRYIMGSAAILIALVLFWFAAAVFGGEPAEEVSVVVPPPTSLAVRTSTPDGANGVLVMASDTAMPSATPVSTNAADMAPTQTLCQQADFDSSGLVDAADEEILTTVLGNPNGTPDARLDLNHDQSIDVRDLAQISECLPTATPTIIPTTAVPEPTATPTPDRCALFDLNSNGILDEGDEEVFDLFIAQDIAYDPHYDLTNDGVININDIAAFGDLMGQQC